MKYYIQGEELDRVDDIRDLGVVMEGKLKYTKQINKVETTAKRNMGIIKRFSKIFNRTSTIRLLYFALVRSHLDFANVVWGPIEEVGIKMLESIQKKFLKFLYSYYKDFTYYDTSLTYRELVIGYERNELRLRRDLTILKQLYNLSLIHISEPTRPY